MVWPLGMAFGTTLLSQLVPPLIAVSYQPIYEDYWTGRQSKRDLKVTGRRHRSARLGVGESARAK
jgi:hypothetical protein